MESGSGLSNITDLGSEVLALVQILKAQSVVSYELGNGKLPRDNQNNLTHLNVLVLGDIALGIVPGIER